MPKLVNENLFANPLRQDDFFDDFHGFVTGTNWTDTSADTGSTVAVATTGVSDIVLTTGGTDNNETLVTSLRSWDILEDKPLLFETRMQYTEVASAKSSIFFGLCSVAAGVDYLPDAGTGIGANFSGFGFQKVEDGTAWQVVSSVGTTQTKNTTTYTAGGASYASFRAEVMPISATQAEVVFLIDENGGSDLQQVVDATTGLPVKHVITYTSFAAALVALAQKTHAAPTLVTNFDYVRVSQVK